MIIRIAPDMFIDERFECVTISEVAREIFQTQKFKDKYPWRINFKDKIKPRGISEIETSDFTLYYQAINKLIASGTVNQKKKRVFNLSKVDQKIAACVLSRNCGITTGDEDLEDFLIQQFSFDYKQAIKPLGLVNKWIMQKLIDWNANLEIIIEDWNKCGEHAQPRSEIKIFEKLTGCKYIGP